MISRHGRTRHEPIVLQRRVAKADPDYHMPRSMSSKQAEGSKLIVRNRRVAGFLLLLLLLLLLSLGLVSGTADARRGGSFGSRGARTYAAPPPTSVSPGYVAPVARSMTPGRPYGSSPAYRPAPSYAPQYGLGRRGGLFGGFGGGLLTGLVTGGLIGGLMGHGWGGGGWGGGGGGGMLPLIFQLALLGGGIWLVMRLFRGGAQGVQAPPFGQGAPFGAPPTIAGWSGSQSEEPIGEPGVEIAITPADQVAFERLLIEVQDAFGHEDYGRLRERTTPEIMSFLAEELSQNATHGRRNEVSSTRLIDAEVSEAWREFQTEFATIAMVYESIDIMRDRATGAVVEGDPNTPTRITELWTFARQGNSPAAWKLSAIQET